MRYHFSNSLYYFHIFRQYFKMILSVFVFLMVPFSLFGALSEIDSLQQLIMETSDDSLLGEYYLRLSVLTDETEPEASITFIKEALYHFTQAEFPLGCARALNGIGYNYWLMGHYTEAINYYTEALKIYESLNDQSGIARVANNLGAIYWGLNNYNKALEYYQMSLEIRQALNDHKGIAIALNNIGLVYQAWNFFDQALEYHHQAVAIAESINDLETMAYSYYTIGLCFDAQKQIDKALEYYRIAYDGYLKAGKTGGATSIVLRGIGDLFYQGNQYEEALYYYRKALSDALLEGNIFRATHARLCMAKTFFALDIADSARYYSQIVLETAQSQKYDQFQRDVFYLLADMEALEENYKEALTYFKMATAIQDSIFNKEKGLQFIELQIQYNLDKKERENEILRKDNEIQMLRIHREKIIRNSLIGSTLLILIVLGILYQQGRHLKQLNKAMALEIQERKAAEAQIASLLKEKELLLKEVHHRIKNNLNTIQSLLSLQAKSLSDPHAKEALKEASSRVQTMSLLYDRLYRSENVQTYSTHAYFSSLIQELIHVFPNRDQVTLKMEIEDFKLPVTNLSTLGIILTELITNAMKYGFPEDRKGFIRVQLYQREDKIILKLCNNGAAFPKDFSLDKSNGFGLQLVSMLVQELKGTFKIHTDEEVCFDIEFPKQGDK